MRSINTDGAKIRRHRELNGFTQDALSRALGVSRTTVANWEGDRKSPRPACFRTLCVMLRVTADQLTTDKPSVTAA